MTTPIFVVTPVNDPIPEAAIKRNNGEISHPAFYTLAVPDGQVYAGSTGDVNARVRAHKNKLKVGSHPYAELQTAVEKDLPVQVTVEYMPSRDAAFDAEQAFLTKNSDNPKLLNKCLDARSPRSGIPSSAYQIQRMKEVHTGRVPSEATRQKLSEAQKGKAKHVRPVEIEGTVHPSIKGASKALGVTVLTVRNRINSPSPKFVNYSFKEKMRPN